MKVQLIQKKYVLFFSDILNNDANMKGECQS